MDNKTLIICGPTATGKTDFALDVCNKFNGEIISADSRQVYKGMNIITGQDIPAGFWLQRSNIKWMDQLIDYYTDGQIRIWLTGVVDPDFQFSVSCFKDLADKIIFDIHSRNKLPVIVGSTGLYIKSLSSNLNLIHVPQDTQLRSKLSQYSAVELYKKLSSLDPIKASGMNNSDRNNPLRLIRAIEIASNPSRFQTQSTTLQENFLSLCLNGPKQMVFNRIDQRVKNRINAGALQEVKNLISVGYDWELKSMQTTGCLVWKPFLESTASFETVEKKWQDGEHRDYKRQLTWFKKQSALNWIDISQKDWQDNALKTIKDWF